MELSEFCTQLHISDEKRYLLGPVWKKLTEGWDGTLPFFLDRAYFSQTYPLCKGPYPEAELLPEVEKVIQICRGNPAAALLAHVCYRGAFLLDPIFELDFLPDELPFFGKESSGMFALLISLGAYPRMVKAYAACGVPPKYADDAMAWMGGTMIAYGVSHDNVPGRPLAFSWIRHYVDKELFRVGRLEYLMHPCPDFLPAIYRRGKDELAVLCGNDWKFRSDGLRAGESDEVVFTSHLAEGENTITGTPVAPDGKVNFKVTQTLDTREWRSAVSPWQLCPSIHIPAGSRMSFEEVKASMIAARDFFARYFQRQVPLFCCTSWILNPEWETLLPGSNVARFRQECYACPAPSWGRRAGMSFLFGRNDVDPEDLPANNSAQRAMQEASKRHKLDAGTIFVLAEDVEKLGARYYRTKYGKR